MTMSSTAIKCSNSLGPKSSKIIAMMSRGSVFSGEKPVISNALDLKSSRFA